MTIKLLIVNALTLFRIIGTIILVPIYKLKGGIVAGIFSLICYFTDFIDGILARYWKCSTFFGAVFDGIADKMLTIINFVVLYLITPYSIIPIIFELLTVGLQFFKFNKNYNVRSNLVGKCKIWILAVSLVVAFVIGDIEKLSIIPGSTINIINSVPKARLYLYVLLPSIIIEFLTFSSYVIEIFRPSKKTEVISYKKNDISGIEKKSGWNHFKSIWLNPEFYEIHKNETNLKDLRKLSKE